ncbi:hypothetical protein [Clostridium felsineum]|uniref:Uncharacterized protein n=1 Tax=Clostridium felsineum TaxID=36839 RepID=A0A1S8L4H9_9CLOT|nr:hypothetical protein [Clostridium felsineum]URZ06757.1 hypothetical protein CLROS_020900 [Clostridium felsineum]URZ11789.1 hypothetical protein CROST_025060 [Clostridium felsineum]
MSKYLAEFMITFLKCFFILVIFGILIPDIIDKILTYIVQKNTNSSGTYFVYNIFNCSKQLILRYIYFFRLLEGYN